MAKDRQFLIVSTGRNTSPWVKRCIQSVADQQYSHFRMVIVDDASTDSSLDIITDTVERLDDRFEVIANDTPKGAMYNQVHAIRKMAPEPDDVIVWLDSDDRFAHEKVLNRLASVYLSNVLMTYGQYASEPHSPTCTPAFAYPPLVIQSNDYRKFAAKPTHPAGGIRFNHLRTVMAKLFYAMDDTDFQDANGRWFQTCCDAAIMIPALEMAAGRFRFIREVLYIYNSENSNSDWRRDPRQVDRDHTHILTRLKKKDPYV